MRLLRVLATICLVATILGLAPQPASAATARQPVVFVHGFASNGAIWNSAVSQFRSAGYASNEIYVFNYNTAQSNVTTAAQLGSYLDQVRTATGWSKVDVVTHSMGGLSSRYCIKFGSCGGKVDDWVSLGGPNHGTYVAGWCNLLLISCQQMLPGSSFLNSLNRSPEVTSGAASWTTYWSWCDEIINPDSSVVLSGASNRNIGCVGHLLMTSNSSVISSVISVVR